MCCIILVILFVITFTKVHAQNETTNVIVSDTESTVPLKPQLNEALLELKRINIGENSNKLYDNPRIIEKNINYYIEQYDKTLLFFAETFGYDIETIKSIYRVKRVISPDFHNTVVELENYFKSDEFKKFMKVWEKKEMKNSKQ